MNEYVLTLSITTKPCLNKKADNLQKTREVPNLNGEWPKSSIDENHDARPTIQ